MFTNDESVKIASKTWLKNSDIIFKMGYMDGAFDGQSASYQTSFDKGFKQGLLFGLRLGYTEALQSLTDSQKSNVSLVDPRKINCQVCINKNPQEKLDNLVNIQEEKNSQYLKTVINKV